MRIRSGKITASNFASACGESSFKSRKNLIHEIRNQIKRDSNEAMLYGIEQEPKARKYYEDLTGKKVIEIGFAISEKYPRIGCSPDGIVLDSNGKWERVLEIKCPKIYPSKYPRGPLVEDYSILDFIYKEHYYQIQGNMHILDLKKADYLIFAEDHQQIFEIEYDRKFCEIMFEELEEFLEEI